MAEAGAPRRRGPGAAVLIVVLYGLLFLAGLLWLRSRSPLFHRGPRASPTAPAASRP